MSPAGEHLGLSEALEVITLVHVASLDILDQLNRSNLSTRWGLAMRKRHQAQPHRSFSCLSVVLPEGAPSHPCLTQSTVIR